MTAELLTVTQAARRLGVSAATVWRRIRSGEVPSVREGWRRLIPEDALRVRPALRAPDPVPPLTEDHPIFRMVGAGRGGGRRPAARDKHAILHR